MKNLKETIRNINKKEREIIDYIMLSDGVTSFENLLNHFDMRKQSSYFYGYCEGSKEIYNSNISKNIRVE